MTPRVGRYTAYYMNTKNGEKTQELFSTPFPDLAERMAFDLLRRLRGPTSLLEPIPKDERADYDIIIVSGDGTVHERIGWERVENLVPAVKVPPKDDPSWRRDKASRGLS